MNSDWLKRQLPWVSLVVLTLIVGSVDPSFLTPESLISLVANFVPLFIMAMGVTFVIYIGGIDLSVQSLANLITVLATVALPMFGVWTALLCIVVGLGVGLVSGFVTTRLLVPSFVSTLAVGFLALSFAKFLSGQRALYMDATLRNDAFGWIMGSSFGVPHELLIAVVLVAGALFIERRTTFGRALKAIGVNEPAAIASGLPTIRIKVLVFGISGALAAVSGLIFSIKMSGGSPTLAAGFLLPAITAVLVGGTPLTGGVGGVINTVIGTLFVAVLRYAMVYFGIDATHQQMFFGLTLIIAIALTIDRKQVRMVK